LNYSDVEKPNGHSGDSVGMIANSIADPCPMTLIKISLAHLTQILDPPIVSPINPLPLALHPSFSV
jgi:hypothetical protein